MGWSRDPFTSISSVRSNPKKRLTLEWFKAPLTQRCLSTPTFLSLLRPVSTHNQTSLPPSPFTKLFLTPMFQLTFSAKFPLAPSEPKSLRSPICPQDQLDGGRPPRPNQRVFSYPSLPKSDPCFHPYEEA